MTRAAALAIAVSILCSAHAAERPHLAAAEDAARWIRASQVRTSAGLTWPADPSDPKSVNYALYSGSPGVVLFLIELHKATGKREYLADARAGADELIARVPQQKDSGLYTGLAGIGFALGEVHRATGDAKYREAARTVVRTLMERAQATGDTQWSTVTDIIGGSAGIGLYLLHAAKTLNEPAARDVAVKAADRLIALGVAEHGGLRWSMDPGFPRRMPNFSHGTAGIAYFLASVYAETRDAKYLDAARAGARYLQAIAKTDGDICLIPHNQPDGLDLFYLGWCHGPTGTARLWPHSKKAKAIFGWFTALTIFFEHLHSFE